MLRHAILFLGCCALASAFSAFQLSSGIEELLQSPLQTNFGCDNRAYGYYADVDNNCQLFHVCTPIEDDSGAVVRTAQFSFGCGDQSVFDQATLSCVWAAEDFDCAAAPSLYDSSNAEFGIVPEKKK